MAEKEDWAALVSVEQRHYRAVEALSSSRADLSKSTTNTRTTTADTSFIRSIEGILRIAAMVSAALGISLIYIITLAEWLTTWSTSSLFFVGFFFNVCCLEFIAIKLYIPLNLVYWRLIDSLLMFANTLLLFCATVACSAYALQVANPWIGIASIFGFISCGLSPVLGVFSLMVWNTRSENRQFKFSMPLFNVP